ncbi:cysteine hydrolase [Mycolicibacterium palauense]|uniref:cysteine hydrolase n=1 Tax=Mycolicibacterium palauense TaxID=2034511 RepID=UPI002E1B19F5
MDKLLPANSALLLIECQNDFMSEGGAFYPSTQAVIETVNMVEHARAALQAARTAGLTVMHAPISFSKGYPELGSDPYGILGGVVEHNALLRGEWGSQIVEELAPVGEDIVIEGKSGLDAFASSNLDFILRSRKIENLVVGGFLANCCCEGTMRSAYEGGYTVYALADAMGASSMEELDNAVKFNFPMFAKVTTADEFVAAVK